MQAIMALTIRSAVFPSQYLGFCLFSIDSLMRASSIELCKIDKSVINLFVHSVIVIGRSVFSRKVKQGILSEVVSSCNPPESVITKVELPTKDTNSR